MKNFPIVLLIAAIAVSCGQKAKDFATVEIGMTKQEVLAQVGEPSKKNDVVFAELWVYDDADRTIAFRSDTVYDIMTSAEARIDSIEGGLRQAGRDIGDKLRATGDTIDSASLNLKNRITGDSTRN